MIFTKNAALTFHTLVLRNLHLDDLNITWAYAQFCLGYVLNATLYFKYILDSFSELNGYHVVRRSYFAPS